MEILQLGHFHGEDVLAAIKAFDSNIAEVFTDREIQERLIIVQEHNPDMDAGEIIQETAKDLAEDASRIHPRSFRTLIKLYLIIKNTLLLE